MSRRYVILSLASLVFAMTAGSLLSAAKPPAVAAPQPPRGKQTVGADLNPAPSAADERTSKSSIPRTVENDPRYAASVTELGTAESKSNNSEAFLFLNGRYIAPPYMLRRDGYAVHLNGVELRRFPVLPDDYQEELPTPPSTITRDTSWRELDKEPMATQKWLNPIARWFLTHYPPQEAASRFADQIRTLPFVKEATWVPPEGESRYLRIVSRSGDERHMYTSWWDPARKEQDLFPVVFGFPQEDRFRPFTSGYLNWIRGELDTTFKIIDTWLRSGQIVVLGEGGPVRAQQNTPQAKSIVEVVEILKSKMPANEKTREIYDRLIHPVDRSDKPERTSSWKTIQTLVSKFVPDPRLDARIEKLRQQREVPK